MLCRSLVWLLCILCQRISSSSPTQSRAFWLEDLPVNVSFDCVIGFCKGEIELAMYKVFQLAPPGQDEARMDALPRSRT